LNVERVGNDASREWDAFVATADGTSVYHLYAWRKLIGDVFGHESLYLAARDARGRICGVLPLVRLRSVLFGDFMVSMPYFNYGGVLAESAEIAAALLSEATTRARELGVSHVELRHVANVRPDWPMRTDKVAMYLSLPATPDELSKRLGAKLRSQIKRPTREGATCVCGGRELLAQFYAVFSRNMRDLGTPVYPEKFFAAILDQFASQSRLFIVRVKDAPVAAGFTIGYRGRLEIPWASALREANSIGVNMLLYWSILEYACQQRFDTFDFGRSTVDSGTYRFKQQWGAQPQQLHWHYWMRSGGTPPMLNPSNPKYRLAVAGWQRLPLAIANRLGPMLVRNLP
jgi:serine/alanine adding enzyme